MPDSHEVYQQYTNFCELVRGIRQTFGMGSGFEGHPILGWLQRKFGLESPSTWAEWAADQLLRETQQLAVPVDLGPMLLSRKATAVVFDQGLLCEARLERGSTGFSIRLRGSLAHGESERYRRFALAHELGHTLFYDLDEIPIRRTIALPLHDPLEEELCDKFAAALLIPRWYLEEIRRELTPTADGPTLLEKVCADCGVPARIAAARLNESLPEMKLCQQSPAVDPGNAPDHGDTRSEQLQSSP